MILPPDTLAAAAATSTIARRSPFRRLLRSPGMLIPAVLLLVIVLACVLAPLFGLPSPDYADVTAVRQPPGHGHLFGTDSSGRDVLSRLLFGGQVTLLAGLTGTAVTFVLGVPLGLAAGYYSGRLDSIANWLSSLIQALPAIVALLAISVLIGSNPVAVMAVFGVLMLPGMFRPVRAAVLDVRRELYVDAAKVSGIGDLSIMGRHILGVVLPVALIQTGFIFGVALIVQAGLQFIGIGTPGAASWGGMLGDAFKDIYNAPFLLVPPAVAITLTVLCLILLASVGRDLISDGATPSRRRRRAAAAPKAAAAAPTGHALLEVQDLVVEYRLDRVDRRVVDGVGFSVQRGRVLGLVGESGSGKTQTVLGVLGLLAPGGQVTEGSARFAGRDLVRMTPAELARLRGSEIGYIPQEPMSNLDPSFTIGSQLVEPIRRHLGLSRKQARARARDLLTRVGIVDPDRTLASFPHQISGGMAQRVLIAGAVSCDPKLIIADEPTTALDVTVQAEVLDLFRSLIAERDIAVVLVTHDFGVVADICDDVVVMRGGHVLESAPAPRLFSAPEHTYTRALLAAAPAHLAPREPKSLDGAPVLLCVQDLQVAYPGRRGNPFVAVRGVSFEIRQGETLGLVGESGSGKSTIGRAILGLAPVTNGDVRWAGASIAHAGRAERRALSSDIQVVFQDPYSSLNPAMAVEDILVEPLLIDPKVTRAEALARVRGLLDAVHLPQDAGRRRAREFSGGQRQRIAIARALSRSPRLIICDEAVSALDLSTQASVLDLFAELQQRTKVAYLFISHDLDVVRHIADNTAVIQHGALVEVGDSEEVATNPREPYTRRLASASPYPDPVIQAERRAQRRAALAADV
ncbi:dipeptide ABC transporter ATP-binding protein [Dactylosporangium sp. CA-092794]|uniref:dipeptide ABC transporter ATP-binding protein n=1 Tax=Dactylosporangium sp. CA-092794 TaxID=3239929 RepID=UPI003D8BC5B5